MKKIICLLLLTSIVLQAISQTETFDIATFNTLKGWKKQGNSGAVTYTNVNATSGAFCVLAMYACSASLGDSEKDFNSEWKDLVVTTYNPQADPKTETQTMADGWKVVSGGAPIKLEAVNAVAILTVYSGFGKKFSVVTTLNDQSYISGVDSLLKNIKLNKTANVTVTQTNNPVSTKPNGMKGQFGSMIYTTPARWDTKKYPDGDILSPVDLPKNEFLEIWVQEPMNFSGTIEQALQKSFDETVTKMQATKMNDVNGGNYTAEKAKVSFRGWEYIRCSGGIHLGAGEYPPEYGLDLFVIKLNNRFERISIIKSRKNCDYSTYYSSSRLNYYNDIENFLFSLQFPDWKEPDVKAGAAKGDGIAGVWQGISLSVGTPKPGAALGAEFRVKEAVFFSNGQVFFGVNFPVEGLDELNSWVKAELNRRDWGTYTFTNGRGVIKLPYGDIPLRMENNKLILTTSKTDHGFIKTNSVDGARFNGTYVLSSKNFVGEETGKTPAITFTTEGKFTDDGALKILVHEPVACLNVAKDPGSGTYEVKNYSVIFNYADGRKIKIAFMGTDFDIKNQTPPSLTLSFNEDVLARK